jgi:hypothetical protein
MAAETADILAYGGILVCLDRVTISLELLYKSTGRLIYHQWWNIWCSYLADWLLFVLFYYYYRLFRFENLS